MEKLNREQRAILRLYKKWERSPNMGEAMRAYITGLEGVAEVRFGDECRELERLGFILHGRTSKGRTYRSERRWYWIDKLLPVALSTTIGGLLTLFGVWLGWHLNHLT
jgi:hypothetical protein